MNSVACLSCFVGGDEELDLLENTIYLSEDFGTSLGLSGIQVVLDAFPKHGQVDLNLGRYQLA